MKYKQKLLIEHYDFSIFSTGTYAFLVSLCIIIILLSNKCFKLFEFLFIFVCVVPILSPYDFISIFLAHFLIIWIHIIYWCFGVLKVFLILYFFVALIPPIFSIILFCDYFPLLWWKVKLRTFLCLILTILLLSTLFTFILLFNYLIINELSLLFLILFLIFGKELTT